MDYWYEGNLNENANRREKEGIVYYIRGVRKVNGRRMERYGVQTHFVEEGESYVRLIQDYVLPLYQPGDILSISEKVISMCQENTVYMEDVKVGWLARFLSCFGHRTKSGIGVTEPHKLQLAINMRGSVRVLFAAVMGALGKLIGKRGLFYKILGVEVAGIDGFYDHSAFESYHQMATLTPKNPDRVCQRIEEKTGIPTMLVDANDIDVVILGESPALKDIPDKILAAYIGDNPAGQDDECTPFILIRDIGNARPEKYVPKKAINGES
ncbi:coenzyme F420-0:L-glutamate ligase [Frisingicoccus sp.]|uniref:coenzyme F420-0:L-glutamate ligase n=1 Tax=Frisingicoccus sp. TaxID=1918627 RepID=UPI00399A7537